MASFDTSKIIANFDAGKTTAITFHYHTEKILKSIEAVFVKILARHDQIYLLDTIITILRELITNAVKANAKRFYFKKIKLDINDTESYNIGIEQFKNDVMLKFTAIEDDLRFTEYVTSVLLSEVDNSIKIVVRNNTPIHPTEMDRINLRIEKAKEYQDFTEAYDDVFDDTEGAGLGLVLTILLLNNTGIGHDSLLIESDDEYTRAHISIPFELQPRQITSKIKDQIVNEVNGLPTFRENILELQRLCKDSNATIDEVVNKIIVDPALTSDILKLANSAYFTATKKIDSLNEAVVRIGFKNLNDVLVATETRKILEDRYPKFSEIWSHSLKVAVYAKTIAENYRMGKVKENAYLGGLLHDLGKIVLLATDKDLISLVVDLTKNRKIRTSTILEEVVLGISHSAIGEVMADKWSFPEYLLRTIRNHHSPLNAEEQYRDLIYVVYLANMICGLEQKKYHFFYFEDEVLKRFNISSEEDLQKLHKKLKEQYDNNQ